MVRFLALILLLAALSVSAQKIEQWQSGFDLKLSHFQSPESEINENLRTYSVYTGTTMDFSFQMNSYEFMFTKNFNSKVKAIFNPSAAVIIAPDSVVAYQLLSFAQYHFDLTELYVRKFRKELNEQKGAFSRVSFFQPIFENLQQALNAETARVQKSTSLGENDVLLAQEHQVVLAQLETFSEWCYECKPPKQK